jgi:hypothetical protein
MNTLIRICLFVSILSLAAPSKAQILISLLFGDALNTPQIEFGLAGGMNRSWIHTIDESEGMNNFNIGFYFHISMFESSYLSTGVQVKSNVGARGMTTYPIGDPDFDDIFAEGELTKEINYFYVPIMWHQRFHNRFYIESGFQLGLRGKAWDYFELEDSYGGDIEYKRDIRDQIDIFDGGLVAGMGYKLKKQIKSSAIGVNYYYALKDVSKVEGISIRNSSVYIYCKIPIGANKTAESKTN